MTTEMKVKDLGPAHIEKMIRIPAHKAEGRLGLVFDIPEIDKVNLALWDEHGMCDQRNFPPDATCEVED